MEQNKLLGYCECCGIEIYENDVHTIIDGNYYCDYCGGEDGLAISELDNGLDASICPYCGSDNTEQLDFDWDNASAKHICRDCNQDYIAWYDDTTEECYEITDRHNKMIKKMED